MRLRGTEVFARVDESGKPLTQKGRVEIRYDPASSRAYHASVTNLEPVDGAPILPDEHCVPAQTTPTQTALASREQAVVRPMPATGGDHPVPVEPGTVVVYADGACSGNPGPAGVGVVLLDGPKRTERSEYLGTATNNIAELTAIRRALEMITDPDRPAVIFTDSRYAVGVLTLGWKARANQALVAELRALLQERPRVRLVHVPGHAGIALNERADQLAREAIAQRRTVQRVLDAPS